MTPPEPLERLHAALEAEKGSAYLLAPDLSIRYVNEGWRRFARQNGAPELASSWGQIGAISRYCVPQLRGAFETTYQRVLAQRTTCSHVYECSSRLVYRKFSVNVRAEQFERLNANLRSAAIIAFLGLCACGFIVGSFISFAQKPWMYRNVPVLGIVGIALAAALFGGVFTWYLFRSRLRKVSVTRWLKKRR